PRARAQGERRAASHAGAVAAVGHRSAVKIVFVFFRKCPSFYIDAVMGVYKCKPGLIWSLLCTVVILVIPSYWDLAVESIPPLLPPPAVPIPRTEIVEDTIQKNRTLVATLIDYEIPVTIANDVADLIKPIFDLRKLRFGNA